MPAVNKPLPIIYASQTGNAEYIARDIHKQCGENDIDATVDSIEVYVKDRKLPDEKIVVFVVSTTGEGDPPDRMTRFWRRIKKEKDGSLLSHLRYAILGLGDTNYSNFCNTAKMLEAKLKELGARSFYDTGYCDDGTGLDKVLDPWVDGFWAVVKKELNALSVAAAAAGASEPGKDVSKDANKHADNNGTGTPTNGTLGKGAKGGLNDLPEVEIPAGAARLPKPFLEVVDVAEQSSEDQAKSFRELLLSLEGEGSVLLPMASVRILTAPEAMKRTIHFELDTTDTPLELFHPGDAFAIKAPNSGPDVEALITRLQLDGDRRIGVKLRSDARRSSVLPSIVPKEGGITVRDLFTHCLDVRSLPRKSFIRMIADYAVDLEEKKTLLHLSAKEGSADFDAKIREPGASLLDILTAFPSCTPPLDRLLETLPPLKPRWFSASNSPALHPHRLHFAFSVVDYVYKPTETPRKGIATGWMEQICETYNALAGASASGVVDQAQLAAKLSEDFHMPEGKFVVKRRGGDTFRLPVDVSEPVIMVGPGTGVAPFLGFVQERTAVKQQSPDVNLGPMWLFFGCRNEDHDYLYREELQQAEEKGVLSRLSVSFSRQEGELKYVQDAIVEHGEEICAWLLERKASVYVCGDAVGMAPGVNNALLQCLIKHGNMGASEAEKWLLELATEKKYHRDVWG
eukprot:Clim_evm37s22 gene=Clim_evmTU37s22